MISFTAIVTLRGTPRFAPAGLPLTPFWKEVPLRATTLPSLAKGRKIHLTPTKSKREERWGRQTRQLTDRPVSRRPVHAVYGVYEHSKSAAFDERKVND